MVTRRQEKVARIIKEIVSHAILHKLDDPRIEGFVTITKIDVSPDIRSAEIYLSVFGKDEKSQKLTFKAIQHAHTRLQCFVAHEMTTRFCPTLKFKQDSHFKKTLETFGIIDEAVADIEDHEEFEGNIE